MNDRVAGGATATVPRQRVKLKETSTSRMKSGLLKIGLMVASSQAAEHACDKMPPGKNCVRLGAVRQARRQTEEENEQLKRNAKRKTRRLQHMQHRVIAHMPIHATHAI